MQRSALDGIVEFLSLDVAVVQTVAFVFVVLVWNVAVLVPMLVFVFVVSVSVSVWIVAVVVVEVVLMDGMLSEVSADLRSFEVLVMVVLVLVGHCDL